MTELGPNALRLAGHQQQLDLRAPAENMRQYQDWREDQLDEGGLSSYMMGFSDMNLFAEGTRLAMRDEVGHYDEEEWDFNQLLDARADLKGAIQPFLDNPEDPNSQHVMEMFVAQPNAVQAEQYLKRLAQQQERAEQMARHPWLAGMGMGTGLAVDMALMALLEIKTLGTATPAVFAAAARSYRNARAAWAATTGAALGSTEAATAAAISNAMNPGTDPSSVLLWGGLGAALGGPLAGAFELRRLVQAGKMTVEEAAEKMARAEMRQGFFGDAESAGAAAAPNPIKSDPYRANTPARGGGSVVAGKLLGTDSLVAKGFRSFGSRLADIAMKGKRAAEATGAQGDKVYSDVMSKIHNPGTFMDEDLVPDPLARQGSVELNWQRFENAIFAQEKAIRHRFGEMRKEVFGENWLQRKAHEHGSHLSSRLEGPLPIRTFGNMINEYRAAKALEARDPEKYSMDAMRTQIMDQLPDDMDTAQADKIWEHVVAAAPEQEALMQDIGRRMVAWGMIEPEELIEGYTPQLWIAHKVAARAEELKHALADHWHKEPDRAWFNENYASADNFADDPTDPGAAAKARQEAEWAEDESWADYAKRREDLARIALEDWGVGVKDKALDDLAEIQEKLRAEKELHQGQLETSIEERLDDRKRAREKQLRKYEAALREAERKNNRSEVARIEALMEASEKRHADEMSKLSEYFRLQRAASKYESDFEFAKRIGQRGPRDLNKQVKADIRNLYRLNQKAAQKAAQRTATEQINDVVQTLAGDTLSVHGALPSGVLGNTGRQKLRSIILNDKRFGELFRDIMRTDLLEINRSLVDDVGNELAFRETFGITTKGRTALMKEIKERAMRGYQADVEAGREINRTSRKKREQMFDEYTNQFFMDKMMPATEAGRQFAALGSSVQAATAAFALGGQQISQLTDFAIAAFNTPKGPLGWVSNWFKGASAREIRQALIDAEDWENLMLIDGVNETGLGRWQGIMDTEDTRWMYDKPGSIVNKAQKITRDVAVLEGYVNLATQMTQYARRFFGGHFVRQLNTDLQDFSNLPSHVKSWYATLGIGSDNASEINDLLRKHGRVVSRGGEKIYMPNRKKWMELGKEDMLRRFDNFMIEAGNLAIIAPTKADKTNMHAHVAGRLYAQFTSFMHAAGRRFVRPLIQNLQIHPTEMRNIAGVLGALFLSVAVDGAKHAARGEAGAWADKWRDSEGQRDILWGALMRSPFLVGFSGAWVDLFSNHFGGNVNDLLESAVGVRPMKETVTRIRTPNAAGLVAGPWANVVGDTVIGGASDMMGGDFHSAGQRALKRAPLMNVWYLQMMAAAMEIRE